MTQISKGLLVVNRLELKFNLNQIDKPYPLFLSMIQPFLFIIYFSYFLNTNLYSVFIINSESHLLIITLL